MANLAGGYMGLLTGPANIRCTSFGVNSSQEVLFYNPVLGINDAVPSGDSTKKEVPGTRTTNLKRIFRPSVINVGGSFSYPATESGIETFYDYAKNGGYIDELNFQYYCGDLIGGNGILFTDSRVNSFDFSIQAGEIANISVDIGCKKSEKVQLSTSYTDPEKLITWDVIKVVTTPEIQHVKGVSFKINNNLSPIYTAGVTGEESLYPYDLRLGIQEVTGSISFYLKQGQVFIPTTKSDPDTIEITCPGLTMKANIFFQTTQAEGATGPVVCELPFVGVGNIFDA